MSEKLCDRSSKFGSIGGFFGIRMCMCPDLSLLAAIVALVFIMNVFGGSFLFRNVTARPLRNDLSWIYCVVGIYTQIIKYVSLNGKMWGRFPRLAV